MLGTYIVNDMVKKGKDAFCGILRLGNCIGGVNPCVASKLYWATVVPSMLYGCQVLCLSESAIDQIEAEHRSFGKRLQSLPITTSNPAAYSLMGWSSVRAYIDSCILNFFYKTLCMSADCIFRKLVTNRFVDLLMRGEEKGGPISMFIKTCYKYNVIEYVRSHVESGEGIAPLQWKSICKEAISAHETLLHRLELNMSSKLLNMANHKLGMHQWWLVAKAYPATLADCKFMIKLLVGEEPLAWNKGRYVKPVSFENRSCKLCNVGAPENVEHFLFDCKALELQRQKLYDGIRLFCPDAEKIIRKKDVKSIVSAQMYVESNYKSKLAIIANLVFTMYRTRQMMLNTALKG